MRKQCGSVEAVSAAEADALFFQAMGIDADSDPYPVYRALRETAPALLTQDGTLVLSSFALCHAALSHPALGKGGDLLGFDLTAASVEDLRRLLGRVRASMAFANPPEHTRLRRLVSSAFTSLQVAALGPRVAERVDQLLDALVPGEETDFVTAVATRLAIAVIADLLGLPEEDHVRFLPWARDFSAVLAGGADAQTLGRAAAAEEEFIAYLTEWLTVKSSCLLEGLLLRLARSHEGGQMSMAEMVSSATLLFGAGFETTSNLLGNGLRAVLEHEGTWERWRAGGVQTTSAVEEMFRFDTPVPIDARSVLEPVRFAGVDLLPGQLVVTLVGAANRDPAVFPQPDRFDATRTGHTHLSFASGVHYCLGARLARLEATTLFSRMVERFGQIELVGLPVRRPGLSLRGHSRLPVIVHR